MNLIKNEPVLIQSAVQAILGLVLAFGVSLSNEQVGSVMAVTAVILAIAARMFVTPTNKLNSGGSTPPVVDGAPPMYPGE